MYSFIQRNTNNTCKFVMNWTLHSTHNNHRGEGVGGPNHIVVFIYIYMVEYFQYLRTQHYLIHFSLLGKPLKSSQTCKQTQLHSKNHNEAMNTMMMWEITISSVWRVIIYSNPVCNCTYSQAKLHLSSCERLHRSTRKSVSTEHLLLRFSSFQSDLYRRLSTFW